MSKIKTFFRNEREFCKNGIVYPNNRECIRKTAVIISVVVLVSAILISADALIGLALSVIV